MPGRSTGASQVVTPATHSELQLLLEAGPSKLTGPYGPCTLRPTTSHIPHTDDHPHPFHPSLDEHKGAT